MSQASTVQWVAATATSLAVIVALFKESFWRWWQRPRLAASIRLRPPDCHQTPVEIPLPTGDESFPELGYYFRLWIENSGRGPAEQVQVFARRLFWGAADGSYVERAEFLPMNLRWTHTGEVYAPRILPEMGRHCELGCILRPRSQLFHLLLEVAPNTGWHLLGAGSHRLELRLAAANAKPKTVELEITFDGVWREDEDAMFRDGISIRRLAEDEGEGRMNWKRGLMRLYVVVWAAWAVGVGVFEGSHVRSALDEYQRASVAIVGRRREPPLPMSQGDLGRLIKKVYPGDYDDLTDEAVGAAALRKWRNPYDRFASLGHAKQLLDAAPDSVIRWFNINARDGTPNGEPSADVLHPRKARMVGPDGTIHLFPGDWSDAEMRLALTKQERGRATRDVARSLGLWLTIGLVLPSMLLLAARWVWSGFQRGPASR